jgi:hypothetical protein
MFAMNLGISISIGTDRKIQDIPWLHIRTIVVFFVLVCGVILVRRSL